jgi:hypothetical protein
MLMSSNESPQMRFAEAGGEDPLLGAVLDVVDHRIEEQPERLQPVTAELRKRMRRLSEGVRVDLHEEIEERVSL